MCRGPNRSQHFGRILGSLTGAVNRTDAKRYDNFDSKRAQSCEPERCAAGLRHAVTPLTRLTAFIQAHRIQRRRGLRRCYNDRVPLFRPHRVHPGTPHTPPTRLAPLLHRPRTLVPASPRSSRHTAYTADAACAAATPTAYPCSGLTAFIQAHCTQRRRGLRRCYTDRVPLFRAHRVHPGTPHTTPTRLAPLLQRPRTSVPGSPRSSRHTAHNADAACAAATPTAYLCSSGASRVRGLRVFADSPRGACR